MVKSETIAAAAASLLLLPAVNGMYTKQSPVLQVDHRTYPDLIAKSNHTSIIEFYAPWCGHCQNLKPAYEKAAKSLTGLAKVAAIDCNEEDNKPFCGSMGVQGFPTLKIVKPGKKPGKPIVEDYQGARTAKGIVDAVLDKVPNHVKRLKDADYAAWVSEDGPKAILFTEKGTVSALLKAVAIDFLGTLNVGQVRNKETEAVDAFGIEDFPTLVLLPGGGQDPIIYDGELKKDPIVKFLSQAATPNPDPAPKAKKEKSSKTDKSKASSASSKMAKSSASQASKQAETDPAGTKTDEEIIDDPTDSPNPQVHAKKPAKVADEPAKPIKSLQDGLSLQQKCLNNKAGTCILALLPAEDVPSPKTLQAIMTLSELHHKHETGGRNLFPFYQLPQSNSQAAALRNKMELSPSDVELIAINGKRSWWRHFSSAEFTMKNVEDWVDAIRMGDLKKLDVPKGLIADASALPAEPVEFDDEAPPPKTGGAGGATEVDPEFERLKESMKDSMPAGMDFELEEIDDDEYERLMNQQGKEEQKVDHDEL